jgi:hypothetical protein
VCVLLDGEESELTFVDHPSSEMSVSIAPLTAQLELFLISISSSG